MVSASWSSGYSRSKEGFYIQEAQNSSKPDHPQRNELECRTSPLSGPNNLGSSDSFRVVGGAFSQSTSSSSDDVSRPVLKYISRVLMEEKLCLSHDSSALLATEKSLYDILGKKHPPITEGEDCRPPTASVTTISRTSSQGSLQVPLVDFNDESVVHFRRGSEDADEILARSIHVSFEAKKRKVVVNSIEEDKLSEMLDKLLLCDDHETLPDGSTVKKNPDKKAGRRNRKRKKDGVVDLRATHILCAEAISGNDYRTAKELLSQVRRHASAFGDGHQRLAYFFANGLEARLLGTKVQSVFAAVMRRKDSPADVIKSCQTYYQACPLIRFAISFTNDMILRAADSARTLHIIDFGILYGFQWPLLIQLFSSKKPVGLPKKLRITGIELPESDSRPNERIRETGRNLAKYCKRFGVSFQYTAIASKNWEKINIEDLKIDRDSEVLVDDCLQRFQNLLDETVDLEQNPRDAVLNLIRKMNPDLFVHSIVNGSYNSPFLAARFREALFHFSALYDMAECNVVRHCRERLYIERELLGREAMNVISCEGSERVERPETYKQWQARTVKAGFRQLPVDREVMKILREKLQDMNKDFMVDEDNGWMLQGWKGRILDASSGWACN